MLYKHEPPQASFALCFKSLQATLLPASEKFVLEFPSPRHLSSSGFLPLDLPGLGYLTENSATAGLTLRGTGIQKPLHHGKVETPLEELLSIHFVTVFCSALCT
jgi:hypothetical protein